MKFRSHLPAYSSVKFGVLILVTALGSASAQTSKVQGTGKPDQSQENQPSLSGRDVEVSAQGEAELQQGSALTRQGSFSEAIPHLLAARAHVTNEYAADFNLALCYLGTSQFKVAIDLLNLLAQAYVGNAQPKEAIASLRKAAAFSPQNEKLYAFVADACMDHQRYRLGLDVVEIGLKNLPQSARLHYENAMFQAQLDELDQAKREFENAAKFAAGSEIGFLSSAHEALMDGNIAEAIRIAREGVKKGFENPALLTILGEALIRSGASPGQADFVEAQTVLEQAVAKQPNDAVSQIALGSVYLAAGRLDDAIAHLEKARQLAPGNPSVYANLGKAYRRNGEKQKAEDAMVTLEELNQDQVNRIRSAPGDRKMSYGRTGLASDAK
jgi:tetratricopeptide (TPR) repeat protein